MVKTETERIGDAVYPSHIIGIHASATDMPRVVKRSRGDVFDEEAQKSICMN